ncbi:3-oxo-5-alpha-steroid 4-dehydrogenase-like protein [Melanomma pulvis-pyrius CBS 109.77]|uniref:Polyprenal reductase n=1 Tax=Melanomma pulvis-pyrius CBS 109.77 TaxID=1314802 RepID=A0A6A6XNM0_9PLEO|nr:3-oxo-5-alpha-steroid 4-dehydrogenase-like protein [Melanomma pulvis-pyrius CBS 109.77]
MDIVAQLPSPAVLLRVFYLGASALILVIQAVPALRARFLAYGSRATPPSSEAPGSTKSHTSAAPGSTEASTSLDQLLDCLASFQVPHGYFAHFYVVSVACSLFWGWQQSNVALATRPAWTAWLLMHIQGGRRLLESYFYTSKSSSRMWIGHYLLGLLFYLTINVAIWIEKPDYSWGRVPQCVRTTFSWRLDALPATILAFHGLQHTYHAYLHRLRTEHASYQMPDHPVFPNLICPHYTCEVIIYLLLSFLAAPAYKPVNWTLACATVFVAVNLGVTAAGTWDWYILRFGPEKMMGKSRMIPWIW